MASSVSEILRRKRQYESVGGQFSKSQISGLARGALEAEQTRVLRFGELGLRKRQLDIQEQYNKGQLSLAERNLAMQEEQGEDQSLAGYLQTGAVFAATDTGQKVIGGAYNTLKGWVSPTTAAVSGAEVTAGGSLLTPTTTTYGGSLLTPTVTSGTAGIGAAELAPTMTTIPVSSAAGAETAAATGGTTIMATNTGAATVAPTTTSAGSTTTAGAGTTFGGVLGSAGVGYLGGSLAGWGAQRLTRAGELGHMGGERTTGRVVGGVAGGIMGGMAAGAMYGSALGPVGTVIGAVVGAVVGWITGGGK